MDSGNQEQQDGVLMFMQITECDNYEKAVHYMQMASQNVDVRAVELYLELEHVQRTQSSQSAASPPVQRQPSNDEERKQVQQLNTAIFNSIFNEQQPELIKQQSTPISQSQRMVQNPVQKKLVEDYKKFLQDKQSAQDQRPLYKRAISGVFNYGKSLSIFDSPKFESLEAKRRDCRFNFILAETLSDNENLVQHGQFRKGCVQWDKNLKNIEISIKNFKPVLLYVHDTSADAYISMILGNETLAQFINKNYQTFGYLKSSQDLADQIKDIFQITKTPCFIILKKDIFDKVIKLKEIHLVPDIDLQELGQELKSQRGQFNKAYIFDEQIKKEVEQEKRQNSFNPFQAQPHLRNQNSSYISDDQRLQQQLRLQQERELRQQQEEAFKLAELQSKQKMKQKEEEERLRKEKEEAKQKEQEERMLHKAQMMSSFEDEPPESEKVVAFQFRMPNGEKLDRRIENHQTIQILFDYVFCHNESSFENPDGPFDLIQTFPKLSLKDKKDQLISDVFQESQMEQLIVTEE